MALTSISATSSSPASPPANAGSPMRDGSLCTAPESPLFSCAIGPKLVAVCGSGTQVVYRYGRPDKVELTSRNLTIASRTFSGGGETQIAAANKDYVYIVYDKTTRTSFGDDGRNDPASTSGLLVRRGGRTLLSKMCDGDAPISSRARKVLTTGAFVPH